MKKFNLFYYYNFADIITNGELDVTNVLNLVNIVQDMEISDLVLTTRYDKLFKANSGNVILTSAVIGELFDKIYARFWNAICFKIRHDLNSDLEVINKEKVYFMTTLLNIMNFTAEKYLTILDIYKNNKEKLLDKVQSITDSINRFNDTPQDGGDFDDDEHTSNINKAHVESGSDFNTLMARIKEIEMSYSNLMLKWTNEFDRIFLREENL